MPEPSVVAWGTANLTSPSIEEDPDIDILSFPNSLKRRKEPDDADPRRAGQADWVNQDSSDRKLVIPVTWSR